jgi:hypothetical protein
MISFGSRYVEEARIFTLTLASFGEFRLTAFCVDVNRRGRLVVTRKATVFDILIASPGDAIDERKVVADLSHDWNAIHYRRSPLVMLQPILWESHARPKLGERPQTIINKTLLRSADIVVAIFKHRLGQETGRHQSGTIEEIEEARNAGIPVLLYFNSSRPSPPPPRPFYIPLMMYHQSGRNT